MASEGMTSAEKKAQKRKDLVKNILIAFLAVMLLLTFFSGTIQNMSLPEVATDYVQSGSVSPQIRGTGTVEADDPYNVEMKETRKIAAVEVKVGDEVKKGDVIYRLEDQESAEVEEAEKALSEMELQYEMALFTGDVPDDVISKIRQGKTSPLDYYQGLVRDINARYNAAVKADAEAQFMIDMRGHEKSYDDADITINVSSQVYTTAEAQYELTKIAGDKESATATVAEAKERITELNTSLSQIDSLRSAMDAYDDKIAAAQTAMDDFMEENADTLNGNPPDPSTQAALYARYTSLLNTLETAKKDKEENYETAQTAYENAVTNQAQLTQALADAEVRLSDAEGELDSIRSREYSLNDLIAANTMTTAQLTEYRDAQTYQLQHNYDKDLAVLNEYKTQTAKVLTEVTKEREQLLTSIKNELTLLNQRTQIDLAREKLEKLNEKSVGAVLEAPIDGTISSLAYVAGETTDPEKAAAVIQVKGKEMSMQFSVTNDQAKGLKVGDIAEPQNSWFYSQFKATLTAIRPDTTDPAGKKLLVFSIDSPEVTAGQSVSVKLGEASKSYDMTVPNSAIREDNNGKFILIVNARSSPLGNRYIASRVDVDVIAQDDTTSAITAAIEGWEYVITTSSAPIKAGQQVRLTSEGY